MTALAPGLGGECGPGRDFQQAVSAAGHSRCGGRVWPLQDPGCGGLQKHTVLLLNGTRVDGTGGQLLDACRAKQCAMRWTGRSHATRANRCRGVIVYVQEPRPEYLSNLYHAVEELFSFVQTAEVAGIELRQAHLIFSLPASAWQENTRMLALFELMFCKVSIYFGPFSPICAQTLVIPMRACLGSVLPATWKPVRACFPGNPYALRVRELMLTTVAVRSYAPKERELMLMTRETASHRRLLLVSQVASCLCRASQLKVTLVSKQLAALSLREQVTLFQRAIAIAGPHGAGLAHMLWMPTGGHVLEFMALSESGLPSKHKRAVTNIYHNMAQWLEHRYTLVQTLNPSCAHIQQAISALGLRGFGNASTCPTAEQLREGRGADSSGGSVASARRTIRPTPTKLPRHRIWSMNSQPLLSSFRSLIKPGER